MGEVLLNAGIRIDAEFGDFRSRLIQIKEVE
jgi:hypothetical protein